MVVELLDQTGEALVLPLAELWATFIVAFPKLVAAVFILIVGYVVASAFGYLLHKLFDKANVDKHLKKSGYAHSIGFLSVSTLAGGLFKWWIFSLFVVEAFSRVDLGIISRLLTDLANWVPQLFIGIILLLAGMVMADFAADRLLHAKRKGVKGIATLVRLFILLFVGLIALEQIGIQVDLARDATLILVAGVAAGLAIAIGMGFGKALQPEAAKIIKRVKKDL